jgi:arginase
MSDIQRKGLGTVLNETYEHLTFNGELMPLHVSVDIDSLDPLYAPATGTPVLGGLTLQELMMIGNSIHDTSKI